MAVKLGLDGKLYRNTGSFATPTWNEVKNVKDLSMTLEKSEADVTTRANNGWKATVATLKDASFEFQLVWDPDDEDFDSFRDSFLNNTTIECAIMDGAIATSGSQGLRASFQVFNFSRSENLEEAMMVTVNLKVTYAANAPQWLDVT